MLIILGLAISPCDAQENIEGQIKKIIEKNLMAVKAENIDLMMKMIHTQSISYLNTEQQMRSIFKNYELDYELISFDFIGISEEYALGRTKQKTIKKSGPAFNNNIIDMVQIFKKEDGQWKFWSQAILEIKYIN